VTLAGNADTGIKAVTTGYVMSDTTLRVRPAPALGQHTDEILAEAGYGADDIAKFRSSALI